MAGTVGLSQALSYARDLKALYETSRARERELERAQERLRHAYAQSRQYAVDLRKTYRRLQHAIFQSLLGLANALEAKDPYTRGHSERVATLARRVALAAGVSPSDADTIAQAGLLHDLGKIGIPERVLRKPGPLDAEEWAVMRRHPIVGAQINAAASASLRQRLEARRELVESETRIVDVDGAGAIDCDGEAALRFERTRLRLGQRDVDAALHHRRRDHEDDHQQHHHVDQTDDVDLGVEHQSIATARASRHQIIPSRTINAISSDPKLSSAPSILLRRAAKIL